MTTFEEFRDSIPAIAESIYVNSGWSGPSPRRVIERMHDFLEMEARVGPASPEGVRIARQTTQDAINVIADFFNAEPSEVAVTHGTTEGTNLVLYGARWQPDDELVTCDLEHMAIANAASVIEERFGVKAVRVETPSDATTQQMLDSYEQAITPRTKVVALSHIQYSSGLRIPIAEIAEMAHRNGALVVVDGAQTGGHIALDVKTLGVDFYAISGQKWVCGPEATGAFWANPDRIREIDPPFSTHLLADLRAESGETAGPPNLLQRFRLASQAPALVAGLTEALGLMQAIGMENVEAHSQALGDRLRSGIGEISACRLTGPAGGPESSGLVSVVLEGWQPAQVVDALSQRWKIAGRAVRYPAATRFSMAAFNDESDVDAVLDALRVLSKEEAPAPEAGGH